MDFYTIIWASYLVPLIQHIHASVKNFIFSTFFKSIEIRSNTPLYNKILYYVTKCVINPHKLYVDGEAFASSSYISTAPEPYTLHDGKYYIRHKRNMIHVWKTRDSIWISCFTIYGRFGVLLDVVETAKQEFQTNFVNGVALNVVSSGYNKSFELVRYIFPRDLKTVVLPEETKDTVCKAIQNFYDSKNFYRKIGISHKLGILFEGVPGTGKTTLIKSLAAKYEIKNMYLVDVTNNDTWALINKIPRRSMIIIEDVDRLFEPKRIEGSREIARWEPKFDMTKMLNFLDGIVELNECIVFMTANNVSILPEVMLRPGRIDLRIHFTYCTKDQIREYTRLFYTPEVATDIIIEELVDKLSDGNITTSELQRHFLLYPKSLRDAIDNFH